MDSKLKSLSEVIVNLLIGFTLGYITNFIILPPYADGIANYDHWAFLQIGMWYTIVSLVRQYAFRRLFERFGDNENMYTLAVKGVRYLLGKKKVNSNETKV